MDTQPATPPSSDTPPSADTSTSSESPPPDSSPHPKEPGELKAEVEERTAQAPEEVKGEVKKALATVLDLIEDPNVTPEDQATYMNIAGGVTSTLKAIRDPDVTPEDRATYIGTVKAMSAATIEALAPTSPSHAPQTPNQMVKSLGNIGAGLVASHDSQSAPDNSKDRKRIQKIFEEACNALRTAQDPKASPEDRKEALKKVKQRIEGLKDSQYLKLIREIKHYKPWAACVETVENRTRQVGWSDGSLWGLSSPSCVASVAEGASQESSTWHGLLVCVQRNPFSSCAEYIPED
ncbi:hypothetical protein ACIOEW_21050 [Streptomyces sp. NPDC087901]|uniref:hypothetical protein n=1 Tax=Streptomyces sp. NPDC087901 TaxID=3365818 RepID=UPI0037F5F742